MHKRRFVRPRAANRQLCITVMHKRRFARPRAAIRQLCITVMHKRRFAFAPTGQPSHEHLECGGPPPLRPSQTAPLGRARRRPAAAEPLDDHDDRQAQRRGGRPGRSSADTGAARSPARPMIAKHIAQSMPARASGQACRIRAFAPEDARVDRGRPREATPPSGPGTRRAGDPRSRSSCVRVACHRRTIPFNRARARSVTGVGDVARFSASRLANRGPLGHS
jgi:hypothetical protein